MSFKSSGFARLIGVLITCALLSVATQQAQALTWLPKLCTGFADCNNRGMGNAGYQNEYNISHWGMIAGHNCTNYAAYRLIKNGIDASYLRGQGMAWQWGGVASAHHVAVDKNPRVGDIAWFSSTSGVGSDGHVAYVEAVSGGRVTVSEDNYKYDGTGDFDWRQYNISDVTGFIHFGGGVDPGPPDADGDGTPDASDRCPNQGGPPSTQGCPDVDGDNVADVDDSCPNMPGLAPLRGCAEEDINPSASTGSDFNGDSQSDYCRRVGGNWPESRIECTMSTGTGFGATYQSGIVDWGLDTGRAWVDFNGDGKTDYCRRVGGNWPESRIECTMSTGTGFGATYQSGIVDWGLDTGRAWVGRTVAKLNPPGQDEPSPPPPGQQSTTDPDAGVTQPAPKPRPGKVSGVKVKRLNARYVRVSWNPASGADSYRGRVVKPSNKKTHWVKVNRPRMLVRLHRPQHVTFAIQAQGPGGNGDVSRWRI